MTNPISPKVRSWIYILGIVIGALAVVIGPLSIAIGLSDEWVAVLISLAGAVGVLTSTLSRANLDSPTVIDDDPTGKLTD